MADTLPTSRDAQTDRFISPCQPPEGYARELLTILVEECNEAAIRVTKALRFGLAEVQPGQPHDNATRLGHEIGDILEVLDRAIMAGLIPAGAIEAGRDNKRRQLAKFMQTAPAAPVQYAGIDKILRPDPLVATKNHGDV